MAEDTPARFEGLAGIRYARIRVTLDCPECASPIPVNGLVPQVLCGACQAVVELTGDLAWKRVLRYGRGEKCMEHGILMNNEGVAALDYFLAFRKRGQRLYRRYEGILLEVDDQPPLCHGCGEELDPTSLVEEVRKEGKDADAFCPGCGDALPIRAPGRWDRLAQRKVVAIVGETAPRGDLGEPETDEAILFSCLGCGAALKVDASSPRLLACEYCEATSYLPDALWLRLHPAQRKRPFWFLMDVDRGELVRTKAIVD